MIFFKKGSVHVVDLESAIYNNNCYPRAEVNLEYPLINSFLSNMLIWNKMHLSSLPS